MVASGHMADEPRLSSAMTLHFYLSSKRGSTRGGREKRTGG